MDEPTFSVEEAMRAQRALREALGLGPETFPAQAFVGMISDEIEQLRRAGRTDEEIAALVTAATGKPMPGELVGRYYATAEERGRG